MNFELSEEQLMLQHSVERFVEKNCSPQLVRKWDKEEIFPEDFYQEMVKAGFVSMVIPNEYGGIGSSMTDCVILYEQIAKPSVDFATRLALQAWGAWILSDFGSESLKAEILPKVATGELKLSFSLTEPDSGSDAASLKTAATYDNGDWVIRGQKVFSSGADAKDNMMIVAVRTSKELTRHEGISLFLIPNWTPGVDIKRLDVIGRKILGLNEIYFDDVRIPEKYLIGEVGKGWKYITAHLERERITLAANYLGNATSALNDACAYAKTRKQFGRALSEFQVIAHFLAEMATELEASRCLTYMAAWKYDQQLPCRKEASMAKLFVSEALQKITEKGMQILGGHGYTLDHDMQRYWRDARNSSVGGGTSQIQKQLIARELGL